MVDSSTKKQQKKAEDFAVGLKSLVEESYSQVDHLRPSAACFHSKII
jgi:hypothetical protein